MMVTHKSLQAALLLLAVLAVAIGTRPANATGDDDRSLARLLQSTGHEFDRQGLEPGIEFQGQAGTMHRGVRCATRPVADFERQFIGTAIAEHLRVAGTQHRRKTTEVPVHFHILRKKDGSWNVTDEQIDEQMRVLNDSFRPYGISFVLDGISRRKKNKFAKKCLRESVERKFKKRYAVDPTTTLNIYSCRPQDDVLGYAYFPSDYPEDSTMHGIVLLHSSFPGGNAFPFDEGDTAVHEAGHYFGLYHTFEGGCSARNDRISDTPREKRPASGCPLTRDTCTEPGLDPVTNFMDYSDDACVEEFTSEQGDWMKDQIDTFRPNLGSN